MSKFIAWVSGLYLVVVLAFSYGFLSYRFQIPPYALIESVLSEVEAYVVGANREDLKQLVTLDLQERPALFPVSSDQRFVSLDPAFSDSGYLLVSRYSKEDKLAIVELVKLSPFTVLHQWKPNLSAIFERSPEFNDGINTASAYRSQHPLLLNDGSLVISSGEGPLVRIDTCGQPLWVLSGHFHHSIEQDAQGNLLVPNVSSRKELVAGVPLRDDGFAVISPDGTILEEYALSDLLLHEEHQGLVLGVGAWEEDRFHLNDVQPIPGQSFRDGVYLSIRNLSSVALFKPGNSELSWVKTGPWINQHDIQILSGGKIGVFGNQLIRGAERVYPEGVGRWFSFDTESGEFESPFRESFKSLGIGTPYEGRAKLLQNGDLFVEDTLSARLLRVTENGARWIYTNMVSPSTVGALHWSRYMDETEVSEDLLNILSNNQCTR